MTWADAMGLVVIEGLIILVLVLTGFRRRSSTRCPPQLKLAISVGIGLFIALIGFVDAGFVRRIPDAASTTVPVQLGADGHARRAGRSLVFAFGLLLLIALWRPQGQGRDPDLDRGHDRAGDHRRGDRRHRPGRQRPSQPDRLGAQRAGAPRRLVDAPDFGTARRSSTCSAPSSAVGVVAAVLLVFTLLLADFFDTMGTVTAVGAEAGLLDEDGNPPNTQRILVVDSLAAAAGGAGRRLVQHLLHRVGRRRRRGRPHRPGQRGHRRAVPARHLLRPAGRRVPSEAAAPALVLVGFLMMPQVKDIDWDDLEIAIPAFLTIVLMPFTYSITRRHRRRLHHLRAASRWCCGKAARRCTR